MSTATSLVWLLREGFRNEVMNEYLAHLAATTGDLYTALLDPEPDEALLDGAGGIIDALCAAGGASLDGYAPQRGHEAAAQTRSGTVRGRLMPAVAEVSMSKHSPVWRG